MAQWRSVPQRAAARATKACAISYASKPRIAEQGIELYEMQAELVLSSGNPPGNCRTLRHSPRLCEQGPAKLRTSPGSGRGRDRSLARRLKLHGRARQDRRA